MSHGEDSGNSPTRPNMLAPEKGPISPDMGWLITAIGPDSNARRKLFKINNLAQKKRYKECNALQKNVTKPKPSQSQSGNWCNFATLGQKKARKNASKAKKFSL